jgi:probable rRNA maturation factor
MGDDGSGGGRARLVAEVTAPGVHRGLASGLGRWLARSAPARARGAVTIALISDAAMRRLNRTYRGIDRATDVLSFPTDDSYVGPSFSSASPAGLKPATRDAGLKPGATRDAGLKPGATYDRGYVGRVDLRRADRGRVGSERKFLGDIAISVHSARRQARQQGHALRDEIRILALHGLLHLLGYDHDADRGEMARVEERLRRRAGLPAGLIARARRLPVSR